MLLIPLMAIDLTFISSNLLKIPHGAWLPLVMGGGLMLIMWTWTRGAQILGEKTRKRQPALGRPDRHAAGAGPPIADPAPRSS